MTDPQALLQTTRFERLTEAIAVLLSLGYLGLPTRMDPWCFLPAALGAGLLGWLCWRRNILAEPAWFYVAFAAYGAWLSSDVQDWTPRRGPSSGTASPSPSRPH